VAIKQIIFFGVVINGRQPFVRVQSGMGRGRLRRLPAAAAVVVVEMA